MVAKSAKSLNSTTSCHVSINHHLPIFPFFFLQRPTKKELEDIKAFEAANPDVPLDQPEVFLKRLADINHFTERIACLMFQAEFQDAISNVSSKLTNLRSTCDFLRNSSSLKKVMALILTFGNYMNGGNRTRGQADGFGLEILGRLKDVKSNVAGVTLLHYIVRARLAQEKDHNFDEPLPLPIPEPADMEAASTINFENLSAELDRLKNELEGKRDHIRIRVCPISFFLFFSLNEINIRHLCSVIFLHPSFQNF